LSVARFRRVDGYTHWQVTEGDALPNPGAEFWTSTLTPPATVSFTRPAVDTNVTLTAWFTNLSMQVALLGDPTSIAYTTVLPQPSLRTSLSRELVQGSSVIVHPADIDAGSAGGTVQGEPLGMHRAMVTVRSGPDTDGAPDDPWIAVNQAGEYTLGLSLMNEAGNTSESVESCALSVAAFSGAFRWTGVADSDWFNVMNWLPNGVPGDGHDVTVGSGSVEVTNATAALRSLIVSNGATLAVSGWHSAIQATDMTLAGTVTHAINDVAATNSLGLWVPQHRVLLIGSNITVAAVGLIDANGKGYRKMQGPGSRGALSGGAGHAGEGGFTHVHGNHGGPGYGDPAVPGQPGSGGGHASYGSSGGGAVRIAASGAVTIDGTIQADALHSSGSYGSGGSGGSIWISCETLKGAASGVLSTKGGNGWYWGGGGSGGRIAVDYDTSAQAALSRPAIRFDGTPGTQPTDNWETFRAWMGSLHLPDTRLIDDELAGKQFQWVQVHIPGWACWEREALILDDCVLGLAEGVALTVTNSLTLTNGAALHVHAAPVDNVLTDFGLEVCVGGNLNVHAASWILPYAQPTNGAVVRFTVGGDLFVAAGGGFDANRRGYTRGYGYNTIIRGAGHGGHSGMGFDGVGWSEPYGDLEYPVQAGSGGSASHAASGRGGGAILLFVEGDAELHGSLLADGSCGPWQRRLRRVDPGRLPNRPGKQQRPAQRRWRPGRRQHRQRRRGGGSPCTTIPSRRRPCPCPRSASRPSPRRRRQPTFTASTPRMARSGCPITSG
ncbi:MAG: hypothetical protein GX590_02460, partial [Lentisphaerae bacterium]|nr:hypothetical protein [Lentisphaerota bacterium]